LALLFFLVNISQGQVQVRDGIQVISSSIGAPTPPKWPSAFEMQYIIELPYVQTVQLVGLKCVAERLQLPL
jgi:hypothetical protein